MQGRVEKKSRPEEKSKGKWRAVEEIKQMENIAYSLILKFFQERQRHPEQIIYYRDVVSEGEFPSKLNHELSAIRRACAKLTGGCKPKVTFIIAQNRHKNRLFVENPNDGIGRTKYIPTGTVVDTEITTLSEIDLLLASQEGIQVIIL